MNRKRKYKLPVPGDENPQGSLVCVSVEQGPYGASEKVCWMISCLCKSCGSSMEMPHGRYRTNTMGCKSCSKRTHSLPVVGELNESGSLICKKVTYKQYGPLKRWMVESECAKCSSILETKHSNFRTATVGCQSCSSSLGGVATQSKPTADKATRHGYCFYFNDKDGTPVACRSSYEVLYANHLNRYNIPFEFEKEWLTTSCRRSYLPDFYLTDSGLYIEIKGYDQPRQKETREILAEEGYEIDVLYKEDLQTVGAMPQSFEKSKKEASHLEMSVEDYLADGLYITY